MRHIRKGSSRVTIPFQLRSTSKAMAQWADQVRKGMLELRDRIPQANTKRGGGGGTKPPFWVDIRVKPNSPPESPVYEATVTLGYVEYQNANAKPSEQGVTGYLVPAIRDAGGNYIELDAPLSNPAIEVPALPLTGNFNYIYLVVRTKADGDPKFEISDCTIEVFGEIKQSEHHVRPNPQSAETEGVYYFLLADTTEVPDSDPPRPKINRRLTGNRFLPNQLIEIENLNTSNDNVAAKEYEIYKGYKPDQDDKHQMRVLKQVGSGVPVLRPFEGDPQDEANDQIKIRGIKGAASQAQITVLGQDTDDDIRIQGNGYSFGTGLGVKSLTVVDGLVTEAFSYDGAQNLNLTIQGYTILTEPPYIGLNSGFSKTLYWRNGIFVGTSENLQEVPPVENNEPLVQETIARIN